MFILFHVFLITTSSTPFIRPAEGDVLAPCRQRDLFKRPAGILAAACHSWIIDAYECHRSSRGDGSYGSFNLCSL